MGKTNRNTSESRGDNRTARNLSGNSDMNTTIKVVVSLAQTPYYVGAFGNNQGWPGIKNPEFRTTNRQKIFTTKYHTKMYLTNMNTTLLPHRFFMGF